jgi:hypothetical protein
MGYSFLFLTTTTDHTVKLVVRPRTLPDMDMIRTNGAVSRAVNSMIFGLVLTTTVTSKAMALRTASLEHPVVIMFLLCGQYSGCHAQNDGKSQHHGKQRFDMLLHFVPSFVELPGIPNSKSFQAL